MSVVLTADNIAFISFFIIAEIALLSICWQKPYKLKYMDEDED